VLTRNFDNESVYLAVSNGMQRILSFLKALFESPYVQIKRRAYTLASVKRHVGLR
jgi:hypothetical protein